MNKLLNAPQKDGSSLEAEPIAAELTNWLNEIGCMEAVGQYLVEQYALSVARWRQSEEAVSRLGLIAKRGRSGDVGASPYIGIAEQYRKQSTELLAEINRIVRLNGITPIRSPIEKGGFNDAHNQRTAYDAGRSARAVHQ